MLGASPDLEEMLGLRVPEYKTPAYSRYSEPLYTRDMVEIFDKSCQAMKMKRERKDVFMRGFTETLMKARDRTNKFVDEQKARGEKLTRIWDFIQDTNATLRDYEHKLSAMETRLITERQTLDDKRDTLFRVFENICAEMAENHEGLVNYPAWDTLEKIDESQSLG